MKLSKKLAVTTVAASVAMSAFAGMPLSNKGLAEKLGVSGVAYAATYSNFVTEASKVYTELDKIPNGVDKVEALRQEIIDAITNDAVVAQSFLDLFFKLADNDPDLAFGIAGLVEDLLSTPVGPGWEVAYEEVREEHAGLLAAVSAKHGVEPVTVDDIATVVFNMEGNIANILGDVGLDQISTVKTQLKLAIANALLSSPKVGLLALEANASADDIQSIYTALRDGDTLTFATADAAYAALKAAYQNANPDDGDGDGDGDGGPGGGGGGGGGGVGAVDTPPSTDLPAEVGELDKKLDDLKDKLANGTDEEKAELIAEAVKETQAVVDKLSKLENKVTVVDGKATLELDESKTLSVIAGIGAALSALKEIAGEGLAKVKVTIDLGDVDAGEVAIGLSDKIMDQAIASGLNAVSLQVGGLTVDLPVGGTFSAAIDFSINKSEATEETTGGLQSASQVYDFNLSIGGETTTTFDQPIVIQIPLGNTDGLDTELLTVAKIVDGKLEFHGGRVVGNSIVESRDTFSSYVVVENKVSFDDTASVEAWAGRAIEVAAAKGAINGKAEGVFDPSANVTRAEFAKMLIRALDLENASAKESFTDVKTADWFTPYVAAAVQQGIINGRSASQFDPQASITRAEMATMISRALKVQGLEDVADVEGALEIFSDAESIGDAFKAGVALAVTNGIVQGSNGKFAPNDNATRAEAAVIIYNALKVE